MQVVEQIVPRRVLVQSPPITSYFN